MDRKNTSSLTSIGHQLDGTLEPFFAKAPQLPANVQEILAKITPYFTVFGVIIAVFGLVVALGLTAAASPMLLMFGGMGGAQALTGGVIGLVFLVIQAALEALAIPGLFKNQRSAWYLLFFASLIGAVYNLITLNLVGLIIGFLISFYLLYQIKPYYNK